MGTIDALKTRRSVRSFRSEPISDDILRQILACGMQAPSACNEQPWQLVVIRDPALLAKSSELNPFAKFANDAPLGVLVCGDSRLEKCKGYWVQDCSNCAMSMLLAAHALGIGAVWTGIFPEQDRVEGFRKLFALPAEVTPLALLVMGHPAATPSPEDRFKQDRIHYDRW